MKFKEFYDKYVLPFFEKILPKLFTEALKWVWKHVLAVLFIASTGGIVVETVYLNHVESDARHAGAVAKQDLANLRKQLDDATADLGRARSDLDGSQKQVAGQQQIIGKLQGQIGRLSEAGSGLASDSGQLVSGELDLAGLLDRSLSLARLGQRQIGGGKP